MERKDYSRAALEFQNAAQLRPQDSEPYYRLGLVYEQTGALGAAVSAYRQALQKNAKHAGAQLKLAGLMANYGDQHVVEEAEQRLRDMVPAETKDSQALNTLAIAEFRLGKADEAARVLEQAVIKYPADIEPAMLLAQLKWGRNDSAGAEEVLKNAARKAQKSAEAALMLGRFYLRANRPDLGEPEIRRALALNSQYAPALLSLALLEMNRTRPEQAEEIYRQLSTNPDKDYQRVYGLFLFQQGKTEAGVKEFQRLARQAPEDRPLRSMLVSAYVISHRTAEAQKVLSDALANNPKDADALLQRAALYLQAGEAAKAQTDLNHVLHERPDSAQAHFEAALAKQMLGLAAVAREELLQALAQDPELLAARLTLARRYLEASEHKAALDLLDNAPERQKSLREIRIMRNWALLGLDDRKTAGAEIERLLAASRGEDALEQDGFLKMMDRNFTGARQEAEEILAQNPQNTRAIRLLMDSYTGANQRTAGIVRLREIAAAHSESPVLHYALGQNLIASGERDSARIALEAALKADSKFAPAQLALGHLDFLDSRLDAARSRVSTVIAGQSRNVTALLAAGDIELRAGDYPTALEKYRAALAVEPSNVLALEASASLLVMAKNLEDARRMAEKAVELAPADARAQETLGWVEYSTGHFAAATERLKQAMALGPTPSRQYHLGLSYVKSGQRSLGQAALAAALQKDPGLPKKDQGW
jgi:tetratricopeptide (TPR) repeat protein